MSNWNTSNKIYVLLFTFRSSLAFFAILSNKPALYITHIVGSYNLLWINAYMLMYSSELKESQSMV